MGTLTRSHKTGFFNANANINAGLITTGQFHETNYAKGNKDLFSFGTEMFVVILKTSNDRHIKSTLPLKIYCQKYTNVLSLVLAQSEQRWLSYGQLKVGVKICIIIFY